VSPAREINRKMDLSHVGVNQPARMSIWRFPKNEEVHTPVDVHLAEEFYQTGK